MKKEEAKELSIQRVNLIMDYINNILSDKEVVNSKMNFSHAKIDGQTMCTLDIYVPSRNFEKHLNLGITYDHINVLYKEFFDRVISDVLPNDEIGATCFYTVKSNMGSFSGIDVINVNDSNININMLGINREVIDEYDKNYKAYADSLKNKSY